MYEYSCRLHGVFRSYSRADSIPCPYSDCDLPGQRRWGFSLQPSFQAGYNLATGTYASRPSDIQSELSRASEAASAPTTLFHADGTPEVVQRPEHHFVPVDLRDKAACGVTNEGLDSTYDALKRQGNEPAAKRLKALMDE